MADFIDNSLGMILLVGVMAIVLIVMIRLFGATRRPPYQKIGNLFTPAEKHFLFTLDRVVGRRGRVFGKVRVADVLSVRDGLREKANNRAFGAIVGKHFDYVICSPRSLAILAVVELNDSSHDRKERRERDQFLRDACTSAGVPLIEVKARRHYDYSAIETAIAPYLGENPEAYEGGRVLKGYQPEPGETPCPRCGAPMVERVSRKSGTESRFLGCSAFPRCRATMPLAPVTEEQNQGG